MKLFICSICFLPLTLLSQLTGSLSSDVSMCVGDGGYTITFTGTNGTMPYTFTYTINGGTPQNITTIAGNSVSLIVPTTIAGVLNYHLTQVIDNLGVTQIVSDNAFATVNPLPIVGAGVDQDICEGACVTLSASGALTYTWNNGVVNGVMFCPAATATYTTTGTSGAGCVNTDQVVVTVNSIPIVNAGADQTVCSGYTVTLNGSGASFYNWNNGVINGVAFVPVSTMTYTVTGTSAMGCINTDQVVVTVDCLSIDEQNQIIVKLYPNPTQSILNIESEIVNNTISIFSTNGQLIKQLAPFSQKSVIDLSDLTQGVYLVELNSEKGRIVKRIIVE